MKNVGGVDRILRLVIGLGLVAYGIFLQVTTGAGWWIAAIGLVPTGTALFSTCPLYIPLKISTAKKD
ncbi:MAG: DUF2892 domain-containing protein [Spirochaetales bacterium]|nr:DUF2892 domain-containing protein [Spirochaetales bacterium]